MAARNAGDRRGEEGHSRHSIVFPLASDPVGDGLVASLARPGGNITRPVERAARSRRKRLEVLREIVPNLTRLAVLAKSRNPPPC